MLLQMALFHSIVCIYIYIFIYIYIYHIIYNVFIYDFIQFYNSYTVVYNVKHICIPLYIYTTSFLSIHLLMDI